jgi:hypothetical protein
MYMKPKMTVDDIFSKKPEVAAMELIDGAYEIVELWEPTMEHQAEWKRLWLEKAREILGLTPKVK